MINPLLAGLQITGILHKIKTNFINLMIKLWSNYDQNSYNGQMISITDLGLLKKCQNRERFLICKVLT